MQRLITVFLILTRALASTDSYFVGMLVLDSQYLYTMISTGITFFSSNILYYLCSDTVQLLSTLIFAPLSIKIFNDLLQDDNGISFC